MRKVVVYALILLALVLPVFAQSATWHPISLKSNWDRLIQGFCPYESQCLVTDTGDDQFDNQPAEYFTVDLTITPPKKPMRCINSTQYLLDYYCEKGKWTTRTKLLALELLSVANQSQVANYGVYCDSYNEVLNRYSYLIGTEPVQKYFTDNPGCFPYNSTQKTACTNNVCVLEYDQGAAFATSLNVPVNHPQRSFLKALNLSTGDCNNVNMGEGFKECDESPGIGRLYYSKDLNAVMYIPQGTLTATSQAPAFNQVFKNNFATIRDYVFAVVHNPQSTGRNFTFFNDTGLFNKVYYANKGSRSIFTFLEEDQTDFRHDYLGVNYKGISLGTNPCFTIFKALGEDLEKGLNAYCENQTSTAQFFVTAKRTPGAGGASPLVDAWKNLGGKLRP